MIHDIQKIKQEKQEQGGKKQSKKVIQKEKV